MFRVQLCEYQIAGCRKDCLIAGAAVITGGHLVTSPFPIGNLLYVESVVGVAERHIDCLSTYVKYEEAGVVLCLSCPSELVTSEMYILGHTARSQ